MLQWRMTKSRRDPRAIAEEMAAGGAAEGSVVRGPVTAGVLPFSVVLRPREGTPMGLLGVVAAFCASEGIRKDTGIITWLRWPHEVVVAAASAETAQERRRWETVAVVSPSTTDPSGPPALVLNYRINVGRSRRPGSTSLEDLLGVSVDPGMLVAKVLDSLSWMHSGWEKEMYPQIVARLGSMLEDAGRRVAVVDRGGGEAVSGVVAGVDREGRLVVEVGGGRTISVEDRARLPDPR